MTQKTLILIAEDDNDDFLIMRSAFEEIQVPVGIHRVENGEQVFQYLNGIADINCLPDLILLDMHMPKLCGMETLILLKANELYKNIPVIIHTSLINEENKEKCLETGAVAFLQKPAGFGKVLSHVSFFISLCTKSRIA